MNPPRRLARPPITEALIDVRVDGAETATRELIQDLEVAIASDYPSKVVRRRVDARVGVTGGQQLEAVAQDLGLQGVAFKAADGKLIAQFRGDGFTLNRLHPYTSWDRIFPESMRLWREFLRVFQPNRVTRLAVRYINHIQLPGGEIRLADCLTSPIPVPRGLPSQLTSFLTSVVLHDRESSCSARVTQSLEPPVQVPSGPVLLLDIDAFRLGDWSPSDDAVGTVLADLRALKNDVFFNSLTPAILAKFE